jgi:protein required for attachment to host cells
VVFLKNGTWVLVADGKKMLVLRNNLDTQDYDLRVVWHREKDNPATRAQGTDRPGRAPSVPGARRATIQQTDWHHLSEARFAKEVAEILDRAAQDGAFEDIVIVAPPRVLGDLRAEIRPETATKVLAEIPKNLTNHPVDRIGSVLKAELDEM